MGKDIFEAVFDAIDMLGWAYPEQLGLSSTACKLVLAICSCTDGVLLLHQIVSVAPLNKPSSLNCDCFNSVPYTLGTTWSMRSDGFG